LKEHIGKVAIGEFKMTFVVKFEQCWAVGMEFLEMYIVLFRLSGCVSTLFANIHLKHEFKL
jgi:hypothetical protein